MNVVLDRMRPHPHRGDVIAAGAVPLAVAAFVIDLRMTQWSTAARFVVVGLIAGLLLALGWLAELEGETPRPYHSVLLVAGLLPLILALTLLAELLGAQHPPGSGGEVWTFGLEAAIAWAAARRANSGVCTLIAALAVAVAVEALVRWVFTPTGLGTFRALLVVLALGYAGGSLRLREHQRRHAVQLVNAAGLVTIVLALTYLATTLVATALRSSGAFLTAFGGQATAPFGWKLYILAIAFGLIAYAAVDREPGPAYIGAALLGAFAVLVGFPVSGRGSLVGWPLFLLIVGGAGLAIGLRPRAPLPPEPPTAPTAPPPPTIPLHRVDER
jgi:hypothetical protein